MDTTALIALISTLVLSIIANIAAWGQIAAQARKDKRQADIDEARLKIEKDKAEAEKETEDRTAILVVTDSLKLEVERLQKRGIELENTVIAKTTEIGELKLTAIDKEAELRTMKYNMENIQMKLNVVLSNQPLGGIELERKEDNLLLARLPSFPPSLDLLLDMKVEIEEDQKKRIMVSENAAMEIQELRDNSISKNDF